jgi:hypothetical protein
MIPNIRIYLMVLALSGAMCEYRSFDGSNNNLDHPNYGAHGSTYVRLQAPAAYADGVGAVAGPERPSTMLISNLVFTATNRLIENDLSISDFLPYWGQFLAHDIICTPADANETMTIPVPACASTGACDGIQVLFNLFPSENQLPRRLIFIFYLNLFQTITDTFLIHGITYNYIFTP